MISVPNARARAVAMASMACPIEASRAVSARYGTSVVLDDRASRARTTNASESKSDVDARVPFQRSGITQRAVRCRQWRTRDQRDQ